MTSGQTEQGDSEIALLKWDTFSCIFFSSRINKFEQPIFYLLRAHCGHKS